MLASDQNRIQVHEDQTKYFHRTKVFWSKLLVCTQQKQKKSSIKLGFLINIDLFIQKPHCEWLAKRINTAKV
jgi:hypothetical protein